MIPKEDENSDISSKDQDSFKFIKQALNNLLMGENNHTKKHVLFEMEKNEKETFNRDEFDEIAVQLSLLFCKYISPLDLLSD